MSTPRTSPNAVVPELSKQSKFESWRGRFGGGWLFLLLVLLIVIFSVLRPSQFVTSFNFSTLAIDASVLLVISVGQAFVIMTAGIDLSVGSVLVFSSIVGGLTMLALSGEKSTTYGQTNAGWGVIAIGLVVSVVAGTAWGVLNGFLIARARIPALIVTLGTMGMALGVAQILTNGQDVRAVPELLVTWVGAGVVGGIPVLVFIAIVIAVIAGIALRFTRFGTWTLATGSNAEAARRSGVPVHSQLIKVYAISGALAGLAGMMSIARFSTTTIAGHTQDNLTTISAVVLGGTSLFGGIGTIIGTVIGLFIPVILLNGFIIMGIPPFWQSVAMGSVLIVAVYIDQFKRRKNTLR